MNFLTPVEIEATIGVLEKYAEVAEKNRLPSIAAQYRRLVKKFKEASGKPLALSPV